MNFTEDDLRLILADAPIFLDIKYLSDLLAVSENSLRKLCLSDLRYIRVGKLIRIPKEWFIEDFAKISRVSSGNF